MCSHFANGLKQSIGVFFYLFDSKCSRKKVKMAHCIGAMNGGNVNQYFTASILYLKDV